MICNSYYMSVFIHCALLVIHVQRVQRNAPPLICCFDCEAGIDAGRMRIVVR